MLNPVHLENSKRLVVYEQPWPSRQNCYLSVQHHALNVSVVPKGSFSYSETVSLAARQFKGEQDFSFFLPICNLARPRLVPLSLVVVITSKGCVITRLQLPSQFNQTRRVTRPEVSQDHYIFTYITSRKTFRFWWQCSFKSTLPNTEGIISST